MKKIENRVQKEELINLLERCKKYPKDLDLINLIAIWYMQNYEMCRDNEDYKFFEKAYKLKKTVKSTHNFASYLFNEEWNSKKALKIQKECVKLKPKSCYPYLLYAETLIWEKMFLEAIKNLEIAQKKEKIWNIEHNLWYCKYMLWDYESAKLHFLNAYKDDDRELKSLFWLILVNYKLGNKEKAYELLKQMKESEYFDNAINNHDIWSIYFLYDDFEKAKENTLRCGLNIDLSDWKCLWYSILMTDKVLFRKEIDEDIRKLKSYIEEIKNDSDDYKDLSEVEREEYISDYLKEIREKESIEKTFKVKPKIDIDKCLVAEYYWCSIFGCDLCGNLRDDI